LAPATASLVRAPCFGPSLASSVSDLVMEAALLIAEVHGWLLRELSLASGHYMGLSQAARGHRHLPAAMKRKLNHLDIAHNLCRHITRPLIENFCSEVAEKVRCKVSVATVEASFTVEKEIAPDLVHVALPPPPDREAVRKKVMVSQSRPLTDEFLRSHFKELRGKMCSKIPVPVLEECNEKPEVLDLYAESLSPTVAEAMREVFPDNVKEPWFDAAFAEYLIKEATLNETKKMLEFAVHARCRPPVLPKK